MVKYVVKKVLNNNVLIAADDENNEVVLIGKGIGFQRKKGDVIRQDTIEKIFVLKNENEQEHYKKLLPYLDEKTLNVIISSLEIIKKRTRGTLNEHIHVALTDHLLFAMNRFMKGMVIKNPFLNETKAMYPFEYEIAEEVVDFIHETANIKLPEGEVGFIALHIHSALTDKQLSEINQYSQLLSDLVRTMEENLGMEIDRNSVEYMRLIRHLRYTIDRVQKGETLEESKKIKELLKKEYPLCYNLSWKLIKIMQQTLKKPVYEAEATYLTMHLQRLRAKQKNSNSLRVTDSIRHE
ncbi:glucose PTS transporter transcription antiterminator GlcT [Bacillus smithii]|uniref:glucose PTS transporter transcription antiterminator GlcT n=1 Tax=Bacillus smithii TaxID=1479 RepID=UPI0030C9D01A